MYYGGCWGSMNHAVGLTHDYNEQHARFVGSRATNCIPYCRRRAVGSSKVVSKQG